MNKRGRFPECLLHAAQILLLAIGLLGAAAIAPSQQVPSGPPTHPQALLAAADDLLGEMSRITGLPIKAPLKKEIRGRAEIRNYLLEDLHAEQTPRELYIQEAALKAFGLVSREFDLEKFLITFYTEQAAGAYDPRRKILFIADWPSPEMQKLVLAHELTHALQDQNFDLRKFLRAARASDDATNARQAVVEGHAMAATMQHVLGPVELASLPSLEALMGAIVNKQLGEFPAFSRAPFFFRLQALFPYAQGVGFMQRGLAQGGWKKLHELFLHPPVATKEIFEPQLYFDAQSLPPVSLPRPASLAHVSGLRLLTENVMGQLGYYALLGQLISEEQAKSVGTGWLADRYVLYEYAGTTPTRYALVARTRWTSPETALAFFRAYHTILARKYPELTPDQRSHPDLFIGSVASGRVVLLRQGDACLWAEGVPAAQTGAVLKFLQSLP